MKTYQPKQSQVNRDWHLIDAEGEVLGRLSTRIATLLMGKHKPGYSRHMDVGDHVVVLNARKIKVTGKKAKQKVYHKHSGYPGGYKAVAYEKYLNEQPHKIIEIAVRGMLPDNRLRSKRMARLKVQAGDTNPFSDKFENGKQK